MTKKKISSFLIFGFVVCLIGEHFVTSWIYSTRDIEISGELEFLHFLCVGSEFDGKVRPVCLYRPGLFGDEPVPTGYGPHDAAYIPAVKKILYRIHRFETPNCVILMLQDRSLVLVPIEFVRSSFEFTEYQSIPTEQRKIGLEDILHDETNGFQIDFLIRERID